MRERIRTYQTPTGIAIRGTIERIPGIARIDGITDNGVPSYAGGTDILWDGMEPLKLRGKIVFLDEDGGTWTFDQLVPVPETKG